ncbi:MAG: hypothetical protein KJ915_03290 [Candidatus Omnitrophica bacterium]|nr:hypothetical protein [Candidatus Omnitrophota bacterium]
MTKNILIMASMLLLLSGFNGVVFAGTVDTKYDITFYGKIKADLSLDDSEVVTGDYGKWVASEATKKDVSAMNLTAAETRLGMKFAGPDYEDMVTNGNIEFDFFDTRLGENKPQPYLRHAYAEVTWTDSDLSLLAGQTWDIVAPLNPTTLNYCVMWWQGNIQYRRPQVRVSKSIDMDNDMKVLFQLAAARNIGDAANTTTFANTNVDTGVDNASPIWEARAALTLPMLTEKMSTIGLSYATGAETVFSDAAKTISKDYDVSLIALDFSLPLVDKVKLLAEYWSGENLDAFLGGIGQGINTTMGKSIGAQGYWASLALGPFDFYSFNIGFGVDDPDDADLNADSRSKNQVIYANVIYDLNEAVKLGLEVANLETEYKGQATAADATRIQASMIYTF